MRNDRNANCMQRSEDPYDGKWHNGRFDKSAFAI